MAGWESVNAVLEVVDVFDELKIPYHVGGSLASSVHGVPRQTNDLDLVAEMTLAAVPALESLLEDRFYLDAETIRRATQRRGSFNLVHLTTGFKIDVFVQGRGNFDRLEFARHGLHTT